MTTRSQEPQDHEGEGQVVLGAYFDAESEVLEEDEQKVWRNAEPASVERPKVEYDKNFPNGSSIIALISQRRVDRVPMGQASRVDACLPCGQDMASQPGLRLYVLPCGHRWCKECLARTFKFAINHNTFHRLNCCTNDEIPLKYFKRIVEDRPTAPGYEPGWEPGSYMEVEQSDKPTEGQNTASMNKSAFRNPLRVSQYVEKDQEVFLNRKDLAVYKLKLEEFDTLPKDKIYCYRRACGSFIPMSCRTRTKGTCPRCHRVTCKRCRKGWHTHERRDGKCDVRKDKMEGVKNDRKLMVLARRRGWKRCPDCRIYVEKVKGGCLSVLCRCGRHFFYG